MTSLSGSVVSLGVTAEHSVDRVRFELFPQLSAVTGVALLRAVLLGSVGRGGATIAVEWRGPYCTVRCNGD